MATSLGATGASAATTDVAVGAPTMDRDASSTGGGAAPRSTCTPTPATVSSLEGAEASPGEEERARSSGELSASSSADVGLQADLRSSSGGGTASDDELDPVLAKALSHPRDRLLLLRAERELIKLIDSPTMTRLPLSPPYFAPALNSYQRLLIHRLADLFGIKREVEPLPPVPSSPESSAISSSVAELASPAQPSTPQPRPGTEGFTRSVVVLVKTEHTRKISFDLATWAPPSAEPATDVPALTDSPVESSVGEPALPKMASSGTTDVPPPQPSPSGDPLKGSLFTILHRRGGSSTGSRRAGSQNSSSAGSMAGDALASGLGEGSSSGAEGVATKRRSKGKARSEMTFEEREAAYKEARERIFRAPPSESSALSDAGASSTPARPSSAASSILSAAARTAPLTAHSPPAATLSHQSTPQNEYSSHEPYEPQMYADGGMHGWADPEAAARYHRQHSHQPRPTLHVSAAPHYDVHYQPPSLPSPALSTTSSISSMQTSNSHAMRLGERGLPTRSVSSVSSTSSLNGRPHSTSAPTRSVTQAAASRAASSTSSSPQAGKRQSESSAQTSGGAKGVRQSAESVNGDDSGSDSGDSPRRSKSIASTSSDVGSSVSVKAQRNLHPSLPAKPLWAAGSSGSSAGAATESRRSNGSTRSSATSSRASSFTSSAPPMPPPPPPPASSYGNMRFVQYNEPPWPTEHLPPWWGRQPAPPPSHPAYYDYGYPVQRDHHAYPVQHAYPHEQMRHEQMRHEQMRHEQMQYGMPPPAPRPHGSGIPSGIPFPQQQPVMPPYVPTQPTVVDSGGDPLSSFDVRRPRPRNTQLYDPKSDASNAASRKMSRASSGSAAAPQPPSPQTSSAGGEGLERRATIRA